jgi:hypothetical protein
VSLIGKEANNIDEVQAGHYAHQTKSSSNTMTRMALWERISVDKPKWWSKWWSHP